MEQKKAGIEKQSDDLAKSLEGLFKSLPHLPQNVTDVLVKIAPWLALIFGVLGVLAGIGAMGISPFALFGGIRSGMMVFFTGLLTLASSVLMLLAYPKLTKRTHKGWTYLFWSEILNAVYALLTVSLGSVIGVLIGLYLLFEIRRYYK